MYVCFVHTREETYLHVQSLIHLTLYYKELRI